MTVHLYFLPVIRVTDPKPSRGPKYLKWIGNPNGVDCHWRMLDYGHIDVAIVAADTMLEQHQEIFDQPDVLSVDPRIGNGRDLDANATQAEVNAMVNYLDNAGNFVPMNWATPGDTRRQILRGICGIFLFIQRLTVLADGTTPRDWSVNLSTEWSELSLDQQAWMTQAMLDLDRTSQRPPVNWTMRQILRAVGNRWTQPIDLELVVL